MGLEVQDVNTLGDIINSTFGRTSTPRSTNTLSITCKILNENTLLITFTTIMTFYNNSQMQAQKNKMNDESKRIINQYIKELKTQFKERAGKTIKLEPKGEGETTLEIYNVQSHINTKKDAFYRHKVFVEFSI